MAQYYEAKEVSKKLHNQLKECNWKSVNDGESFEIELPVVLYFNYQRLKLYIYPTDDGYYVSDDGQTFCEHCDTTQYYYDLFNEKDKNFHYDIQLVKNYLCKKYRFDFTLMCAIDEFVRFFVHLDIFMTENDIV